MTATARRLRNGLLRPWVVDYMAGLDQVQRLSREQGLTLDLDPYETHALGVAVAEAQGEGHAPAPDLTLNDEASQALDAIVARRACMPWTGTCTCGEHLDQAQAPTPELHPWTAEDPAVWNSSGLDAGQGEHYVREQQQNRRPESDD